MQRNHFEKLATKTFAEKEESRGRFFCVLFLFGGFFSLSQETPSDGAKIHKKSAKVIEKKEEANDGRIFGVR